MGKKMKTDEKSLTQIHSSSQAWLIEENKNPGGGNGVIKGENKALVEDAYVVVKARIDECMIGTICILAEYEDKLFGRAIKGLVGMYLKRHQWIFYGSLEEFVEDKKSQGELRVVCLLHLESVV